MRELARLDNSVWMCSSFHMLLAQHVNSCKVGSASCLGLLGAPILQGLGLSMQGSSPWQSLQVSIGDRLYEAKTQTKGLQRWLHADMQSAQSSVGSLALCSCQAPARVSSAFVCTLLLRVGKPYQLPAVTAVCLFAEVFCTEAPALLVRAIVLSGCPWLCTYSWYYLL